jgi:hypothetical protein
VWTASSSPGQPGQSVEPFARDSTAGIGAVRLLDVATLGPRRPDEELVTADIRDLETNVVGTYDFSRACPLTARLPSMMG